MHTETYHDGLKEDTDKLVFQNATLRAEELKRASQGMPSYEELEAKIKSLEEENRILKLTQA